MPNCSSTSRGSVLWGLLLLNAALLAVLGAVTLGGSAEAQVRPRGKYLMVGGEAQGAPAGVVYIADMVSQELIALTYDHNVKDIAGIGYRHMAVDAAAASGRTN